MLLGSCVDSVDSYLCTMPASRKECSILRSPSTGPQLRWSKQGAQMLYHLSLQNIESIVVNGKVWVSSANMLRNSDRGSFLLFKYLPMDPLKRSMSCVLAGSSVNILKPQVKSVQQAHDVKCKGGNVSN